jgi:HPt (histidine-containing phosphotransfer) domain-containing protein
MRIWAITAIVAAGLATGLLLALRARWRRRSAAASPLDRRALDEIRRLEADGGAGLLNEIIDTYLGTTPGLLAGLEEAVREDTPEALWRTAHNLKGSSISLGAEAVSDLCGRLEALGRSGTTKDARALLDALEQACESARRALVAEKTGACNG